MWTKFSGKNGVAKMIRQKKLIDAAGDARRKYIDRYKKKGEGRKWSKLSGDIHVRILREYILKELPKNYTVSPPYAYIEGFPYEFDILILRDLSKPLECTNIYSPEDVRVGIEVKAGGFMKKEEIRKTRNNFDDVKEKYTHIDFIYLTFEERSKPKRANSINYWSITKDEFSKGLSSYKVFCLRDSYTKEVKDGWKNLVSYLKEML